MENITESKELLLKIAKKRDKMKPRSVPLCLCLVFVLSSTPSFGQGNISSLSKGQTLISGSSLNSPNGRYRVTMQTDGNLVLYDGSKLIWTTMLKARGARVTLQQDGNLVIQQYVLGMGDLTFWDTATANKGNQLVLQDSGDLVFWIRRENPSGR